MTTDELKTIIVLLKLENEALRSVLSEYEEDKSHFTQWMKAEDIRRVLEMFND